MHTERQIAIFAVAASRGDQGAAQKLVTLLQAAGHFCKLCGAMLSAGSCLAHHAHGGRTRSLVYYRLSRAPFETWQVADRELEIAENVFAASGDRAGEVFARECQHVLGYAVQTVKRSSYKVPKETREVVLLSRKLRGMEST